MGLRPYRPRHARRLDAGGALTNLCLAGLVLSAVLLPHGLADAGVGQAAVSERAWSSADQLSCERLTTDMVSYQLQLAVAGRPDDPSMSAPDLATADPRVAGRVTETVAAVLSTATGELLAMQDRVVAHVVAAHRSQVLALCAHP